MIVNGGCDGCRRTSLLLVLKTGLLKILNESVVHITFILCDIRSIKIAQCQIFTVCMRNLTELLGKDRQIVPQSGGVP